MDHNIFSKLDRLEISGVMGKNVRWQEIGK